MNKLLATLVLCICALGSQAQPAITGSSVQPLPDDSLYQAFGAKPGLDKLMAHFVPRLKADPRIGAMFKDTNLKELQTQLSDQLCVVSGGPCKYEGAKMKEAHADMKIRKSDFNTLVEILQQSMDAQGIPFATQNRMLAQLAPMHRDVVNTR